MSVQSELSDVQVIPMDEHRQRRRESWVNNADSEDVPTGYQISTEVRDNPGRRVNGYANKGNRGSTFMYERAG